MLTLVKGSAVTNARWTGKTQREHGTSAGSGSALETAKTQAAIQAASSRASAVASHLLLLGPWRMCSIVVCLCESGNEVLAYSCSSA
jgi:hypothetical protein